MFKNANGITGDWPLEWENWMNENINFTDRISMSSETYGKRINSILKQFQGLLDGFNNSPNVNANITKLDLWFLQSGGDMDDLITVWNVTQPKDPEVTLKCTGLLKLAPNYEDVWFAQDTWSDYTDLNAILKEYSFNASIFPNHKIIISTRAGLIPSGDDFLDI